MDIPFEDQFTNDKGASMFKVTFNGTTYDVNCDWMKNRKDILELLMTMINHPEHAKIKTYRQKKADLVSQITPKIKLLTDWKVETKIVTRFYLPAGTYYIGDLCYALDDDLYKRWLDDFDGEHAVYTNERSYFAVESSPNCPLEDNHGEEVVEDAGIIGIASIDLCGNKDKINGGKVITFTSEVECELKIGSYHFYDNNLEGCSIRTAKDYDDDYDE